MLPRRTDPQAIPPRQVGLLGTPPWAGWLVPGVALAVVAVSTLTQPYGRTRNLVSMIVALVVAVATLALWRAADRPSPTRPRLLALLPFALAAMAVTSGGASLTTSGGPFSLLSSLATTIAGSTFSLGVATAITATGALAVLSTGLAYGVGTWGTFGYPLVMFFGLLLGLLLRGYRIHAEQSAALMANLKQLQAEQRRSAAVDERNRIAREIHDVLAHTLGSLGVQIQAAQALLTDQGGHRTSGGPCSGRPGAPRPTGSAKPAGPCTHCELTRRRFPAP